MKRLHPLVGLSRAFGYAVYGLGIPIFGLSMASIALGDRVFEILPMLPVTGLGLVVGGTFGVLWYLRFTYRITDDTFDVFSGVLQRREREIPHRRIQNVDVTRNVWQNLFGLAIVRIETAGGGSTEARLDFVSVSEAEHLQRVLRERREATKGDHPDPAEAGTDDESAPSIPSDRTWGGAGSVANQGGAEPGEESAPRALFALSPMELALHAVTTFRPGTLLLLVIGTPFLEGFVTDVLLTAAAPLGGPERLVLSALKPDDALVLSVVGGPLWIASAWLIGIALGLNQYYGFRLGRRGEELVYDRGLLSDFSGAIPLEKIQTLTVRENVLQRAFGYAALSIDTAGYAGGAASAAGTRSAIPLAERDRVASLVDRIEGADLHAAFRRPPTRARLRYAIRYALALGVILGIAFAVSRSIQDFSLWWTPVLAFLLVPILAHLKWKHRGYVLGDKHLLVRSGFFRRRTQVVPYRRLQTVTRSQTVFQRRRDLASLVPDTASGAVLGRGAAVAYDQPADETADLQDRLRERLQASLRG